jgi:hypothetical protein
MEESSFCIIPVYIPQFSWGKIEAKNHKKSLRISGIVVDVETGNLSQIAWFLICNDSI